MYMFAKHVTCIGVRKGGRKEGEFYKQFKILTSYTCHMQQLTVQCHLQYENKYVILAMHNKNVTTDVMGIGGVIHLVLIVFLLRVL